MRIWMLTNQCLLHEARAILGDWLENPKTFLRVRIDLMVPKDFIFTKQNTIKKVDCSNRIKATFDVIGQMLLIDDRRFFVDRVQWVLSDEKKAELSFRPTTLIRS